jgi:hypothetical protein
VTNSSTMRAAVVEEYNSAFRLMDVARPKAGAGQGTGADQGERRGWDVVACWDTRNASHPTMPVCRAGWDFRSDDFADGAGDFFSCRFYCSAADSPAAMV